MNTAQSQPPSPAGRPAAALAIVTSLLVVGGLFLSRPSRKHNPTKQNPAPIAAATPSSNSSNEMTNLLGRLARETDSNPHAYWNHALAERIEQRMHLATNVYERMFFTLELAEETLNANQLDRSAGLFEEFFSLVRKHDPEFWSSDRARLQTRLAIAHLRRSEQANCIAHHNPASCLFPIAGEGVHAHPDGARKAIALLNQVLSEKPDDLHARWLLTVASMALGEAPDPQTVSRLIPKEAFESPHDVGRFTDIAANTGLAVQGMAGGSALDDFDNDGDLDLIASSWGQTDQLRFFTNDGTGRFSERTKEAGLPGLFGGLNLTQADYDNDGDIDLFVARGAWLEAAGQHPNSLIRNNGDGTFTDVTEAAGMLSFHPTSSAAWFDFDNDGFLDLFVCNETVDKSDPHPCELFRNQGDGTFDEIASKVGLDVTGYTKGASAGDYDNDGWADLYVSDYSGPNRLFKNGGATSPAALPRFSDAAAQAGVTEPRHSFPCWFWDYDNDGHLDLFVADYDADNRADIVRGYLKRPLKGQGARLYRNRGDGTFTDVTRPAGLQLATLAMGVNFGDLDNDGFLDFYLGSGTPDFGDIYPNRMFRNAEGKAFQDVTTSGGFGHLQKGHGIAFGDIDNDGDQDVYAVMGGAYTGDEFFNALFQNPGHGANWIKLKLIGRKVNRSAIGARVRLLINDNGPSREIHRVVGSGGSFGCNPLRLEIGLGKAAIVTLLEIRWPGSQETLSLNDLEANSSYAITEGSEGFEKQ